MTPNLSHQLMTTGIIGLENFLDIVTSMIQECAIATLFMSIGDFRAWKPIL